MLSLRIWNCKRGIFLLAFDRERDLKLSPVMCCKEILEIREHIRNIHLEESIADYVYDIVSATRNDPAITLGASPRALLAFVRILKSFAFLAGREYVLPQDVQYLAVPVLAHRIKISSESASSGLTASAAVKNIVKKLSVPV